VRRRRRRPNVGVAPAPFSWHVHVICRTQAICCQISVMPFTTKLEHWQKALRTMGECFAVAIDTQIKHGGVKAKLYSWTILWKWTLMLKVSYGTLLEIWLIKWMVYSRHEHGSIFINPTQPIKLVLVWQKYTFRSFFIQASLRQNTASCNSHARKTSY